MIYLCDTSGIGSGHESWLIVRSQRNLDPALLRLVRPVPELSPSVKLLAETVARKKGFRFDRQWFETAYSRQFLRELADAPQARTRLNELYRRSFKEDIYLACFCSNEALCHRSIVAGLLLGAGAVVQCDGAYVSYWHQYQRLPKAMAEGK